MNVPTYLAKSNEVTSVSQIRLLLIGAGGHGKTTAAETFPNPLFVDCDNQMPPEIKAKGLPILPVWDSSFCKTACMELNKKGKGMVGPEVAARYPTEFITHFLRVEGPSFTPEQTLVFDVLTAIADRLMEQVDTVHKKDIEKNPYERYTLFAKWFLALHELIKSLRCNVVMIAHEEEIRDDDSNRLLGRKWLLPGKKFSNRMPTFYNNIFRQIRLTEVVGAVPTVTLNKKLDVNEDVKHTYLWQIAPDESFEYARTTIQSSKKFVPASYESFTNPPK